MIINIRTPISPDIAPRHHNLALPLQKKIKEKIDITRYQFPETDEQSLPRKKCTHTLSLSPFVLLLTIRGDPILGRHLRLLLLLLRLLLLLLMVLVLMMMVVQVMADVDRELGRMGQLVEVGRRRRRRLRLMAGMHMVIVASRLRILAGMRGREVRMLRTATVRQETVHGS